MPPRTIGQATKLTAGGGEDVEMIVRPTLAARAQEPHRSIPGQLGRTNFPVARSERPDRASGLDQVQVTPARPLGAEHDAAAGQPLEKRWPATIGLDRRPP